MTAIYVATEDALSEAVVERIIGSVGGHMEVTPIRKNGVGYLRKKFPELVRLARSIPVLLVVDLDRADCAPTLISEWCRNSPIPSGMIFRVAVREVEAWLMADREAFGTFIRAPINQIPIDPDTLGDPKQILLGLVRRYANRQTKEAVLPRRGATSKVGIGYNSELVRFVRDSWRPDFAARNSESLARMLPRMTVLRGV